MPTIPDLDAPIRTAIVNDTEITDLLSPYANSYPVFTRRPAPTDTPFPYVMVFENTNLAHNDGINDQRVTVIREIAVYGAANPPPEQWRRVDDIARKIVARFHRQPQNLVIPDWKVINILVNTRGFPPNDVLAQSVGMIIILTIELAARNT